MLTRVVVVGKRQGSLGFIKQVPHPQVPHPQVPQARQHGSHTGHTGHSGHGPSRHPCVHSQHGGRGPCGLRIQRRRNPSSAYSCRCWKRDVVHQQQGPGHVSPLQLQVHHGEVALGQAGHAATRTRRRGRAAAPTSARSEPHSTRAGRRCVGAPWERGCATKGADVAVGLIAVVVARGVLCPPRSRCPPGHVGVLGRLAASCHFTPPAAIPRCQQHTGNRAGRDTGGGTNTEAPANTNADRNQPELNSCKTPFPCAQTHPAPVCPRASLTQAASQSYRAGRDQEAVQILRLQRTQMLTAISLSSTPAKHPSHARKPTQPPCAHVRA